MTPSSEAEHHISETVELLSERAAEGRPKATVVRWVLVAEVLVPGEDEVSLDIVASDNLTSWQASGLAWALEKQAEDLHFID